MENNFLLTDELLWDYADGFLSGAEKIQVETYLAQHPEWRMRLQIIRDEKLELASIPLEAPNPGFADRVMAAWAAEHVASKASAKGNDWIIRLIAAVFGLFILTPVIVMVVGAVQLPPEETPAYQLPKLPEVDWSVWAGSPVLQYTLLLALAFAGLRFLDKYLQHKRLTHQFGN